MSTVIPEAIELARAALDILLAFGRDPQNADMSSYYRYFQHQGMQDVYVLLRSFFTVDQNKKTVVNPDLNGVTISLDAPLRADGTPHPAFTDACSKPDYHACLFNKWNGISGFPEPAGPSNAILVICLSAYSVRNLPPWNELAAGTATCGMFNGDGNNYAQFAMESLSATVFHELMHFKWLFRNSKSSVSTEMIGDYDASKDKKNTNGVPGNGYGPWNAWQLNIAPQLSPGMVPNPVFYNADSYVMFAL